MKKISWVKATDIRGFCGKLEALGLTICEIMALIFMRVKSKSFPNIEPLYDVEMVAPSMRSTTFS